MYHIVFSPLLDTNRTERPVIGVFRRCLWAFSASTRAPKTWVSVLFKELYFSPREQANKQQRSLSNTFGSLKKKKIAEEFVLLIAGRAGILPERCVSATIALDINRFPI